MGFEETCVVGGAAQVVVSCSTLIQLCLYQCTMSIKTIGVLTPTPRSTILSCTISPLCIVDDQTWRGKTSTPDHKLNLIHTHAHTYTHTHMHTYTYTCTHMSQSRELGSVCVPDLILVWNAEHSVLLQNLLTLLMRQKNKFA